MCASIFPIVARYGDATGWWESGAGGMVGAGDDRGAVVVVRAEHARHRWVEPDRRRCRVPPVRDAGGPAGSAAAEHVQGRTPRAAVRPRAAARGRAPALPRVRVRRPADQCRAHRDAGPGHGAPLRHAARAGAWPGLDVAAAGGRAGTHHRGGRGERVPGRRRRLPDRGRAAARRRVRLGGVHDRPAAYEPDAPADGADRLHRLEPDGARPDVVRRDAVAPARGQRWARRRAAPHRSPGHRDRSDVDALLRLLRQGARQRTGLGRWRGEPGADRRRRRADLRGAHRCRPRRRAGTHRGRRRHLQPGLLRPGRRLSRPPEPPSAYRRPGRARRRTAVRTPCRRPPR